MTHHSQLESLGNLTKEEIEELVTLEMYSDLVSVEDQVRRWVLRLKAEYPDAALKLVEQTTPILARGVNGIEDVKKLCIVIRLFVNGFTIGYEGRSYTASSLGQVRVL